MKRDGPGGNEGRERPSGLASGCVEASSAVQECSRTTHSMVPGTRFLSLACILLTCHPPWREQVSPLMGFSSVFRLNLFFFLHEGTLG